MLIIVTIDNVQHELGTYDMNAARRYLKQSIADARKLSAGGRIVTTIDLYAQDFRDSDTLDLDDAWLAGWTMEHGWKVLRHDWLAGVVADRQHRHETGRCYPK